MDNTPTVDGLMQEFADRTGLSTDTQPPRRYLWTDAFAVCNYLGLYDLVGEESYLHAASQLIEQVHTVLGRYSDDDSRSGWISGCDETAGRRHPTCGGLRIGKRLSERKPGEPFDEYLEWDRDGQYFHYLTKWMHALNTTTRTCGDPIFNRWALELAKAAYSGFSHTTSAGGKKRLYWKMSIDLSYPLVPSMGQHDPLDALITFTQLSATAREGAVVRAEHRLDQEISELTAMCAGRNWATDDTLGIGGILTDALKLSQLIAAEKLCESERLAGLLRDAEIGLGALVRGGCFDRPIHHRLAFRELGLSIGLHALEALQQVIDQQPGAFPNRRALATRLDTLDKYSRLSQDIEAFWLEPVHQHVPGWLDHTDINSVMLATSLAPAGYLALTAQHSHYVV